MGVGEALIDVKDEAAADSGAGGGVAGDGVAKSAKSRKLQLAHETEYIRRHIESAKGDSCQINETYHHRRRCLIQPSFSRRRGSFQGIFVP